MTLPPRPTRQRRITIVLILALVGSCAVLPWNLEAVSSLDGFAAAWSRLTEYLAAFTAPDLSLPMVARCRDLAIETLSLAVLGSALGLVLAYPLAMLSCRALTLGTDPRRPWSAALARGALEFGRFVLDALRGVPDFLWAIVLANFTGVNPVTGVLAIAISVAGIFGKVLSEQWDNVDPQRYAALQSTGASRLAVFFYGIQPLAARSAQSFVLMRVECAVRNASVIGVFGGGGLGGALWDEYTDGNWSRVATVLLALLSVTLVTDLTANLLRRQLRVDPNHPRASRNTGRRQTAQRRLVVFVSIAAVVGLALYALAEPIRRAVDDLDRIEWPFVKEFVRGLSVPDLSADTLLSVAHHSLVPLAIGFLSVAIGALGAAVLSFPASVAFQVEAYRFTGENLGRLAMLRRWLLIVLARAVALLCRGIPEVAWVIVLSVFFKTGVTPCVLAVGLHSIGVLGRVFTETVDNVPYAQLERLGNGCRPHVFLYAALPRCWSDWSTYAFFQYEVNMRIGIALGIVGAGGLGDRFDSNLKFRHFATASSYLWAMVLLTMLIDRTSRWLQLRRNRC